MNQAVNRQHYDPFTGIREVRPRQQPFTVWHDGQVIWFAVTWAEATRKMTEHIERLASQR